MSHPAAAPCGPSLESGVGCQFGRRFAPVLMSWVIALSSALAAEPKRPPVPSPWANWIEPGSPFFSSVLDARLPGEPKGAENLAPRGLVLRVGENVWVGFDT